MRTILCLAILGLSSATAIAQDAIPAPEATPVASVEINDQQPAEERIDTLSSLRWLIGEWVDEDKQTIVACKCTAFGERGFIKRVFEVSTEGQPSMQVVELIGYDPVLERIQSWTFDTEGGFGTGIWAQEGNRWIVKTSFQLASGETASATNVMTKVDDNTVRWKSVGRQVDGELQPSIEEVTVLRKSK